MKLLKYFNPQLSHGLDICSTEIRLTSLRRKKQHISVEKMDVLSLPSGAVVDGKIRQPEVVTAYLKSMVEKAQIHDEEVSIALPMQSVINKKISSTESINHINDHFPGIDDVLAYDYIEMLNERLLIAARADQLLLYVNTVENAGLKIAVVDVDLYALARAVHFAIHHKVQSSPILLLELNQSDSQLMLLNKNKIPHQEDILGNRIEVPLKKILKLNQEIQKIYFVGDMPNAEEHMANVSRELSIIAERIHVLDMPNNFLVSCGLALRGFVNAYY